MKRYSAAFGPVFPADNRSRFLPIFKSRLLSLALCHFRYGFIVHLVVVSFLVILFSVCGLYSGLDLSITPHRLFNVECACVQLSILSIKPRIATSHYFYHTLRLLKMNACFPHEFLSLDAYVPGSFRLP